MSALLPLILGEDNLKVHYPPRRRHDCMPSRTVDPVTTCPGDRQVRRWHTTAPALLKSFLIGFHHNRARQRAGCFYSPALCTVVDVCPVASMTSTSSFHRCIGYNRFVSLWASGAMTIGPSFNWCLSSTATPLVMCLTRGCVFLSLPFLWRLTQHETNLLATLIL